MLRQARRRLLEGIDTPTPAAAAINGRVTRSWRRSMAAGLAPFHPHAPDNLPHPELRRVLALHRDLLGHSQPVMEYLFEQVRHSHSMVVLANRHGVLMHTLGDADFLGKAERVALLAGASWHEEQRGTNAIGTALAESCGIEILSLIHI